MNTIQIENFLREQIPLAVSMELRVLNADKKRVELLAPLAPNRNHLGGAFGGSLQTLLIFSGYTWLFHYLSETGSCHVLIQESRTQYLKPVYEDMRVICLAPEESEIQKFLTVYNRKGKARITLQATVEIKDGVACKFEGDFVAERSKVSALN